MTIKEFRAQYALGSLQNIPYCLNPFKRWYFLYVVHKNMDNPIAKERLKGCKTDCVLDMGCICICIGIVSMYLMQIVSIGWTVFIIGPSVSFIYSSLRKKNKDISICDPREIREVREIQDKYTKKVMEETKEEIKETMKLTFKQIRKGVQNGLFKKQKR